jgi:hypothetical protein
VLTLYGASGGADTTSDLYAIDPATGDLTVIGPIGYAITGLVYDATTDTLFGSTSNNSAASPRSLITIDRNTGAGTLVGPMGLVRPAGDIACSPSGVLYGWRSGIFSCLVSIDKVTGAGTTIGSTVVFGGVIEFVGNVLYRIGQAPGEFVATVNLSTGVLTNVVVMSGETPISSGASYHDGTMYLCGSGRLYTIDLVTGVVTLVSTVAAAPLIDAIAWERGAPPTQVFGGSRFYEAPPWRFIVGDLEDNTLTFLDQLAMDRSVTVTRAASRVISGRVPSDNPEVNIPAPAPDSEPFVSEGTRIVSCFRREAPAGSAPWVCRARGLVLSLTDDADTDHATSTFVAYDPWKYLYSRPVINPDTDSPLDATSYPAGYRANNIITEQLLLAQVDGGTVFTDFDSTAFYTGTIENTDPLPDGGDGLAVTFPTGTTLGEMLDILVATGTCDVVFDPIYDIANRPGLLCQLSIYRSAGSFRPNAVMGWDRWPRSLVQLSRQVEGTERANITQMYAGLGGLSVPEESDAASIARFGQYWSLAYLPGVPSLAGAHTIAQRQLALLKDGQYTYSISPASERAPLLFEEYREADTVPIYASDRFRDPISGLPVRVESIPIVIGDDELERVNQMLVSFAPESGS